MKLQIPVTGENLIPTGQYHIRNWRRNDREILCWAGAISTATLAGHVPDVVLDEQEGEAKNRRSRSFVSH